MISGSMTNIIGVSVFTTRGCPWCHIEFPDGSHQEGLQEHIRMKHYCRWCHRAFKTSAARQDHYATKHRVCPVCQEAFVSAETFNNHRVKPRCPSQVIFTACLKVPDHHEYRCLECWKSFHSVKDIVRHRSLHREDKWYSCEDCNLKASPNDIAKHVLNTTHMHCRSPLPPAYKNAKSGPD